MYPQDHEKAGQVFKQKDCFVVMNGSGIFYLVELSGHYQYVTKLSNTLEKYDVIWSE